MTRVVTFKKWTTLALTGATAGLVVGHPALAQIAPDKPETLWFAASEGGEGGESGAIEGASPDVAHLTRLALVEGHLMAAVNLYAKGMTDEAVGLAGHPEAEMMDEVRAGLAQRAAADFTPDLEAVGEAMYDGAPQAEVDAKMAQLSRAIATAANANNVPLRVRFDAMIALLRAAAGEYAGSIENGAVSDPMAYHEAYGFIRIAEREAGALSVYDDPVAAKAAARITAALPETDAAFGDMAETTLLAGDASLLYAVAAQAEFASAAVK